ACGDCPNAWSPRRIGEPKAKAKRPRQTSLVREAKREPRAIRLVTAKKPSTCSARGFGSRGRKASNRSTACSAGPGSGSHAARELQKQHRHYRQQNKCSLTTHLFTLYWH